VTSFQYDDDGVESTSGWGNTAPRGALLPNDGDQWNMVDKARWSEGQWPPPGIVSWIVILTGLIIKCISDDANTAGTDEDEAGNDFDSRVLLGVDVDAVGDCEDDRK
jgi:hypothetical protein